MKKFLILSIILTLLIAGNLFAQPNVFDPNDPVVTYNSANPPATPSENTIAKWVRTARMNWNTDKFKAYYFNGMAFRLRYPNGYNPSDPTKKYPLILFFHGGGEVAGVTDNELHLFNGAQMFEQRMNAGQFDGFMLFPQEKNGSWNYSYFVRINNILDSLQKYCNLDPDRVINMGLSNGGYASLAYTEDFPQRSSTVIASSPALINILFNRQENSKHIPLWVSSGGTDFNPDPVNTRTYIDSFVNKGGDIRWSFFPDLGHATWDQQWAEPYLIPYWTSAHKANPLTFFKRNKFSSEAAVNARLGISPGFFQYQWQRNNVDLPGGVSNEIIATQFGSYRVRFKRLSNSNWSDWSPVPAVISLDNTAPTVPTNLRVNFTGRNYVNLDWNNSNDNSGVTGYDIYVNGVKMYTTAESSITAANLNPNTSYSFTVKAVDLAGNNSAFSNAVSGTTTSTANGLKYRYYEGVWNFLPNFNALTPVKTGSAANIDLSPRNVNNNFGFVWEGHINIPTPGDYTFELISDDGSNLYFNSFYIPTAIPTVNNDGLHGARSGATTINIANAGLYPFTVSYFEKDGGESMQLYWYGPGIPRQLVPNSAFVEGPSQPDNIPPSIPANLHSTSIGSTFVDLDWDNSTDNVGVTGYDVYVNNVKIYTTPVSNIRANNLTPNTPYTFTVKALDQAGNTSAFSNAVTVTTVGQANGLNYRYYEGDWDVLPNFTALTPIKTGLTPNIDLSVRNRNDYFGFVWDGYINIPTAGSYTFELVSDDGSKLYFNSFYSQSAIALVNNDGLHSPHSVSGTVDIAAGLYPIGITFFEKWGGETMQLYWTGPGIPRQLIPNVAFTDNAQPDNIPPSAPANLKALNTSVTFINLDWDNSTDNVGVTGYDVYVNGVKTYTTSESAILANNLNSNTTYTFTVKAFDYAGNTSGFSNQVTATTTNLSNGLNYRYYEGDWNVLPNFNSLTPVKTGVTPNIDMSVRNVNDYFGFVWEGNIKIPTAGNYTFEIISDDGSKLYFNSHYSPTATALVNNDGLHGPHSVSGTVNIATAGLYPIAITFFEKWGGETMQVYWTGPGIPRQLIPNSAFTEGAVVPSSINAGNLNSSLVDAPAEVNITEARDANASVIDAGNRKITKAYPNPFAESLNVEFYNTGSNRISVGIYDLSGKLVQNHNFGNLPAGNTSLKFNLSTQQQINSGVYVVRLNINGVPLKIWKMIKEKK